MKKVILNSKFYLILAFFLPLLYAPIIFSQSDDCADKLVQAEEEYQAGNFSVAVDLIKPCLKSSGLNEVEKVKAYRLLGLVYIAQELEKDASEAVKNLLILVPKYNVDLENDPPGLKVIIDNVSKDLVPEIHSITPDNIYSGQDKVAIKVIGKNFVYGSSVRFNNVDKNTNYINTNELEVELASSDIGIDGQYDISVYSPIQDGIVSNSVKLNIGSQRLKFTINGMLPMPMGDFAADKGNEGDGYAKMGFGISAGINYPLSTGGLGWITDIAFLYNGQSSGPMGSYLYDSGLDYTNESGSYSTIPIMSGLSYKAVLSSSVDALLSGQIGYSFLNIGDESYQFSGILEDISVSVSDKYKYESASSFSFSVGGGVIINNLILISAKYLSLGQPELKYEETLVIQDIDTGETVSGTYNDSRKQSFSYFTLSVGIIF